MLYLLSKDVLAASGAIPTALRLVKVLRIKNAFVLFTDPMAPPFALAQALFFNPMAPHFGDEAGRRGRLTHTELPPTPRL